MGEHRRGSPWAAGGPGATRADEAARDADRAVPRQVGKAPSPPRKTVEPPRQGGTLGLPMATALVVGNIVGTGIFLLPATLAQYGVVSLVAFGIVTIGALALAVVFGRLGSRVPAAGGPYAYARDAFGEFPGFWTAWSFWITAWAGNAGIAVAWVGYVNYFLRWESTLGHIVIGLVAVWVPALVNLTGVKNAGSFQLVTAILKFVPLILVGVVGLFFMRAENFGPFNATGGSLLAAISIAGAVLLFSYSGVESASIAAEKVRDPARNIGRATILGTLACAALYLLSTVAIFGTVPHGQLVRSERPFADAIDHMFGGGVWGALVAACAIISGIGALNGWTLLVAEMPRAAAADGLFPRVFQRLERGNVPFVGIIAGAVLTSLTLLLNYLGGGGDQVFQNILLLATFTTVIPYFFAACAQLYWLTTEGRRVDHRHLARDVILAVLAILFSLWMAYGAGPTAVFQGVLMLLVGVLVYVWVKAAKGRYGAAV
ncbi:amino acid permease [Bailinhaonella thermotolerans]|uniref:Amino acid permease n=1 Tax=Bailinhaonella thermotolerans TaxID=1070861 RepID=A0A3A4AZV1_9ACTN|nr:amino acid permease [Bailinhaonella thermotolerans]RJL31363.1 amino acid permease [Bailinhaonella thermotolerans]